MEAFFSGKVALVTGAGRGIGRGIAKRLYSYGAVVHAIDINKENLESLVIECPSIQTIELDLADWDSTRKAVENIGLLDLVVNNAGILPTINSFINVDKEQFDKIFSVNLMAPINIGQIAGKSMLASGKGGSIVNVSSVSGLIANMPHIVPPYNIAKAGLDMVTKCMASELGPSIRVNAINPSTVSTDFSKDLWANTVIDRAGDDAYRARHPLARPCEVEEVVDVVVFLLSDKSSYITGHCLPVDGGLLCR